MIKQKKTNFIILFVCSYGIYAYLSINMVLPALPHLTDVFNTSQSNIKLSVTMLLLGYSIAQLIWGMLSDQYGRRFIILLAIIIATMGSLFSAVAHSIFFFSMARLIEGFGSGFGPSLGRLVAKDSLDKKGLHICITYIVSIVALMPAIAPVIGGQIMHWLGWRAILYILALAGIILYFMTYTTLPETIYSKSTLSFRKILHNFWVTLTNRTYMGYFLAYSLTLSGLITFYVMAPYMFIAHLHVSSSIYGFLLLFVGITYMLGATLNRKLVHQLSVNALIWIGFCFSSLAVLSLIIFYAFLGMTIMTVLLPASLFAVACGFISPTTNAAAMSSIVGDAGVPVSLLGCGLMAISTITTAILAHFSYDSLLPLTLTFGILTVLSITCYYFLVLHPARHN